MLTENHTPAWTLIIECEQLAEQRFHEPVRVRVALLPSLDGDSWLAEIRPSEPPGSAATLLVMPAARGKLGALRQLVDALRALAEPSTSPA